MAILKTERILVELGICRRRAAVADIIQYCVGKDGRHHGGYRIQDDNCLTYLRRIATTVGNRIGTDDLFGTRF